MITSGMYLSLGESIMILRRRHGLSQSQLAKRAGLSTDIVKEIEKDNDSIRLSELVAVSEVLGVFFHAALQPKKTELLMPRKEVIEDEKQSAEEETAE